MVPLQHPIQVVSRLTGLSPHVIRVWEKRYGAVVPARTGTNRRLYLDEEVERLRLLARATEAGHKIGIIAKLGLEDLRRLVASVSNGGGMHEMSGGLDGAGMTGGRTPERLKRSGESAGAASGAGNGAGVAGRRVEGSEELADARLVREALEATRGFRADALRTVLENGAVRLGHNGVLHRLISPFAQEIGDLWQRGEITAAHEHFASAVIRDFLMQSARPYSFEERAPRAIVTTPAGQLHELGAVMVAAAAANLGWRPIYLGPSLPSAEIAGAALQNGARAVLLSIVYPADDRGLAKDLVLLRRLLPASIEIVVGGRASRAYGAALKEIGAIAPDGLEELCDLLEEMRNAGVGEDDLAGV